MNRWRRVFALLAATVLWALALGGASAAAASLPGGASAQAISAGTFVVAQGTTHQGDISLNMGTVIVRGTEVGSVHVGMGQIEVSGHVTGSAQVGMGQVVLTHGARVDGATQVGMGQVSRLGPGAALPDGGSVPNGVGVNTTTSLNAPFAVFAGPGGLMRNLVFGLPAGVAIWLGLVGRVSWWLLSLAVAFVILSLFPEPTRAIAADIANAPGPALGWGLLVALAAGPAAVLLMITVLGIPLAFVLGLVLLAAKVMGYVAVALLLGGRALPPLGVERATVGWELVAGTVLLLLVGSIPVLGWLVGVAVALLGIGACGRTGFGTGRPWFRRTSPANPAP